MPTGQARAVLQNGLPPLDPELASGLLEATRQWPLLLHLANKWLVRGVQGGPGADEMARLLLDQLQVRGPNAVSDPGENVAPDDPVSRARSVEATIKASTSLLSPTDAERLAELAVFAEGQVIPFSLAAGLWQATAGLSAQGAVGLSAQLCELGLAAPAEDSGLELHEVIGDYLRAGLVAARLPELNGKLLDGAAGMLPAAEPIEAGRAGPRVAWWQSSDDGGGPTAEAQRRNLADAARYIDQNIIRHMVAAGRRQEAEDLVCDLRWVLHRLQTSGAAYVLADLAEAGTPRTDQLSGTVNRIAHLLDETTGHSDASQFLLNALRSEPHWAGQVHILEAARSGTSLVSQWPLPDNPGSALLYVLAVPAVDRHGDAVALSPDGTSLVLASYGGMYKGDTESRRTSLAYETDGSTRQICFSHDGRQIAALEDGGLVSIRDTESWSEIATVREAGILWSAAFTADSSWVITTGNDGRVKAWDARTGEQIRREDFDFFAEFVRGSSSESRASSVAVVSGDGNWVVSGGADGQVFLWNLPDGTPAAAFRAGAAVNGGLTPVGLIRHVAAAPDCSWVAGSADRKIYVWETDSGELLRTLEASAEVTALAASADGGLLASGDTHGTLLVWESSEFTQVARLDGHGGVSSLSFAPESRSRLLYSGGGGEVRAWDLRNATTVPSSQESAPAEHVIVSSDGDWVAIALADGQVHVRDAASGQVQATLGVPGRVRQRIAAAPDGTWLATEMGGTVSIWSTASWAKANEFDIGHTTGYISQILTSANSRELLTRDGIAVRAWDIDTGKQLRCMTNILSEPEALCFSHDGSYLAAGDYYGSIWLWSAHQGNLISTMRTGYYQARLRSVTATPQGTLLAHAYSGQFEEWDINRASVIGAATMRSAGQNAVIAPDGLTVIAAGPDGTKRHDADSVEVGILTESDTQSWRPSQYSAHLAFSGDGHRFAVSDGHRIQIWDRPTHDLHATIHTDARAIALAFRENQLAVGRENYLAIWDTRNKEVVRSFTLSDGYIHALAFSPDGTQLAIASGDEVRILSPESGDVQKLSGNLGGLHGAAYSHGNGSHLATIGKQGVRLWDARNGHAIDFLDCRDHPRRALFGPSGEWIALAGSSWIQVYSLPKSELIHTLQLDPHQENISDIAVTPAGTHILALMSSGYLIALDITTGHTGRLADLGQGAVDIMAISPNGKWLATGGSSLSVHRLPDGSPVAAHAMNRRVKSLAWAPDSKSIASAGEGGVYFLRLANIQA
jgi:WD40 repeat protein